MNMRAQTSEVNLNRPQNPYKSIMNNTKDKDTDSSVQKNKFINIENNRSIFSQKDKRERSFDHFKI